MKNLFFLFGFLVCCAVGPQGEKLDARFQSPLADEL
jgi:hypothetical protein